ncbi:ABC transporter ATP-binding protein, partial [Halobium palmae]
LDAGHEVVAFDAAEPSFEEVFLRLTDRGEAGSDVGERGKGNGDRAEDGGGDREREATNPSADGGGDR